MASAADPSEPSPKQLAELSALADRTLDPARRSEVQAWIAASPRLTALYERACVHGSKPSVRARVCELAVGSAMGEPWWGRSQPSL